MRQVESEVEERLLLNLNLYLNTVSGGHMLSVSAVIATYNGTRYLVEAVESALRQTYPLLEIIVVDDGSSQDIRSLVAPFEPLVRYVRRENGGPAAARNHGIRMARGDLIALLDDDDLWRPSKTADQVAIMEEHPDCALVYGYPELIDDAGERITNEPPNEFPSGQVYLQFLTTNRINSPSGTLIRREVFEQVGYFDEHRDCVSCEDYDLWLRIANCHEVRFSPGILFSYRVRDSGISRNLDRHLKANFYVFNKLICQHIKEARLSDREFCRAFNFNLHQTLKRFAYGYYFTLANREKAKSLMLEALQKRPCTPRDLLYFLIFAMPDWLFEPLRRAKQRLAAVQTAGAK